VVQGRAQVIAGVRSESLTSGTYGARLPDQRSPDGRLVRGRGIARTWHAWQVLAGHHARVGAFFLRRIDVDRVAKARAARR